MIEDPCIRIGTHDGPFHGDDVLAMAILTTIFTSHQVIRTRDSALIEMVDIAIDIGGVYNHITRRYDHHMVNPPKDRFGHLFSSAGLIWRHYAHTYLRTIGIPKTHIHKGVEIPLVQIVEKIMKSRWIVPIDKADNGNADGPTPITELVGALNPIDAERSSRRFNALFLEAVSMVSVMFKRACFHAVDQVLSRAIFQLSDPELQCDGKLLISEVELKSFGIFSNTDVHYVIYPGEDFNDGLIHYMIRPTRTAYEKTYKTPIPYPYCGASREELSEFGCEGVEFVHHTGFMAKAETLEAAVDFCTKLLNSNSG